MTVHTSPNLLKQQVGNSKIYIHPVQRDLDHTPVQRLVQYAHWYLSMYSSIPEFMSENVVYFILHTYCKNTVMITHFFHIAIWEVFDLWFRIPLKLTCRTCCGVRERVVSIASVTRYILLIVLILTVYIKQFWWKTPSNSPDHIPCRCRTAV